MEQKNYTRSSQIILSSQKTNAIAINTKQPQNKKLERAFAICLLERGSKASNTIGK